MLQNDESDHRQCLQTDNDKTGTWNNYRILTEYRFYFGFSEGLAPLFWVDLSIGSHQGCVAVLITLQ